jgi:hypothetical protein
VSFTHVEKAHTRYLSSFRLLLFHDNLLHKVMIFISVGLIGPWAV